MRGEAHYALANEWLALLTERFHAAHPACRCLAIEWSVWAGVGMGERLGRLDALVHDGITPIRLEEGVSLLALGVLQGGSVAAVFGIPVLGASAALVSVSAFAGALAMTMAVYPR
jgi:hypothetical protein